MKVVKSQNKFADNTAHVKGINIYYVFIFALFLNFSAQAQNYNWITPNQTYLKMYVSNDGMYRIDKNDFVNAGIVVSSIDPRTVKVYFKGNQIPIYFFGEDNASFDDSDYFDFYGQRNYGGITKSYDIANNVVYSTDEYFDLYSDTSFYFVAWGGAFGLRYNDYSTSAFTNYPINFYYERLHFEQDLIYSLGQNVSTNDFGYFNNEKYIGEGWYWRVLQTSNFIDQAFNVNSLPTASQQCRLKIFAYPGNQTTSIFNEHRLALKMNSTQLDTLFRDDFNRFDTTIYFSSSVLVNGNNTFRVLNRPATGFAGVINFDMFEVSYPREFVFNNNLLSFKSEISDTAAKIFRIRGYAPSPPLFIYDNKNSIRISNFTFSGDTLIFSGKGNGEYQIINNNISLKPIRIKQRQVPNLVTSSSGADYIIVYNRLFEGPAEQLRAYRNAKDGFRSFKAEIEDIYDVFNYGMESPAAIKRFTKNAFDTWQTPKFKYLCLLGRGSLDPKRNLGSSSAYYKNYIPVYGNPTTDGYFANYTLNTFNYTRQVSVGRLPAYTVQEAQDMVNKIILYESGESNPINLWKRNLMITVGASRSEQLLFIDRANSFISAYIQTPPVSGEPRRVFKNDTTGYVTYNYRDSVINELNRGSLIANYIGHAGSSTWEMSLDNPTELTNNFFQFVLSMTCFTGRSSEGNVRGFSEKFILSPNNGAIGFIGTTGWSFSNTGNNLNGYLLKAYANDTLRRIGDIHAKASNYLAPDSSTFGINTNNCYNLIGDPGAKLLLPVYPEFCITESDYELSNKNPSLNEIMNLRIFPGNFGLHADSCKIRYQLFKGNTINILRDTVVYNWGYVDTIDYRFKIDSMGLYEMKITLDVENWHTRELTTNNSIDIPIIVNNSAFAPLKPVNNQIVYNDSVKFVGLNPNINLNHNSVKLLLEIDTTLNFNSGHKKTYYKNGYSGVSTEFSVPFTGQDSSIVVVWRMGAIINNDTSEWSSVSMLKVNDDGLLNDSLLKLNLNKNLQYENKLFNLSNYLNNIILKSFNGSLYVRSLGGNSYEASYFRVNNSALYIDQSSPFAGLSMLKVKRNTGRIEKFFNLRMNTGTSSDSALAFLNTFDTTSFLLCLNASYVPGGYGFNTATKEKMRQFGSIYADSVQAFGFFHTWSFIGYLGALPSQVSEQYFYFIPARGWLESISQMSPLFLNTNGYITQTFGPAQRWQNFNWEQEVYPNSGLYFDVYGINRNNQEMLLMSNVTTNNNVDLSGIDAYQYPYLKLITTLSIDSLYGFQSPVFKGINLNYVGTPEIALDNNSIFKSDSIVSAGDSIGIGGLYYNVGYVPVNGHVRTFSALDGAGNKVHLRTDTVLAQLKVDSSMFVKATFKVNGLPIHKKYNNQVSIVFEVNSLNQNEIYDYNNSVISTFVVKGSITDINTEVFSDGVKLFGNDYVRSNPELLVKLSGNSVDELLGTDTSVFRIMLNNNFISLNPASSKSKVRTNLIKEVDKGTLVLKFTPQLQNGINDLKLITYKNNSYDTAKFVLNVTNETSLKDVYNYPNPMKTETVFSFTLTGNQLPTECRIKIYTAAGRVIKEINVPAGIGFNQIQWDGRDGDGDYIANGVYFYRVVFKGSTEAVSDIRKLVVLK
ncbi:MAG: C25 family cysteine peptidase [Ignavibacteria bacterium]